MPMAARAKPAVASLALFATTWLLLDWGAVDSLLAQVAGPVEADSPALRGVRRLSSSGDANSQQTEYSFFANACWQVVYGIIYYCCIVKNYPVLTGEPTAQARETQSKNELMAFLTCENSFVINLTSLFCPAARSAHTYDKVGLMPYWLGLLLSAFCPCGTLLYMNACTDLNVKLGGEKRDILMAVICSCFFPCCVIAQDAQALDECTGATVTLCGVEGGDSGQGEQSPKATSSLRPS
jgi:hypothetical protein